MKDRLLYSPDGPFRSACDVLRHRSPSAEVWPRRGFALEVRRVYVRSADGCILAVYEQLVEHCHYHYWYHKWEVNGFQTQWVHKECSNVS